MDNSASLIDKTWDGKTLPTMPIIKPPTGSIVECQHCETPAFSILNDNIVIIHRHHGQYHKTIVPLREFGYIKIA